MRYFRAYELAGPDHVYETTEENFSSSFNRHEYWGFTMEDDESIEDVHRTISDKYPGHNWVIHTFTGVYPE